MEGTPKKYSRKRGNVNNSFIEKFLDDVKIANNAIVANAVIFWNVKGKPILAEVRKRYSYKQLDTLHLK